MPIPAGTLATLRADFGGTIADWVASSAGGAIRFGSATLTFWDSPVGGSQHTDLMVGASSVDSIHVGIDGKIPVFQGPPGVMSMWVDAGQDRVLMNSADYAADYASAAGAYAAQAQEAAASLAGLGTTTDTLVAAQINDSGSDTRDAGNSVWGQLPGAADKVVFVTSRGDDSNDGKTLKTAFLTIQAAITALGGPGLIQLGYGGITTPSLLDLASTNGITIRGVAAPTAGATPATSITFSGTGSGSFIDARSSAGFALRDVMVLYSNPAFTGRLVDLRDAGSANTAFAAITDCYLGGASAIRTANCLVDISNTHSIRFERVQFRSGADVGLRGRNVNSDTCNSITVEKCYFNDNTTAHILNPGDGWTIKDCTFEALHSGAAGAVKCESGFTCNSVKVVGGWAGDVIASAGGIQYDFIGNNISIETFIGGNTGSIGVRFQNVGAAAPVGLTVASRFDGCTTGIDFTGVAPEGFDFSRSSFAANVTTKTTGGVGFYTSIDMRDGAPHSLLGLRNRSTTDGRVPIRFQADRTSSYVYDLGIDLDGANGKRFGLRDITRSGTPWAWWVTALGSVVNGSGTADLATTVTDGFTYIPTVNGTPTGTPSAITGMAPMCVDRSTNKLYVYVAGAWKAATLT